MRQPLKESYRDLGRKVSIPAPVGGWNARDALAAMSPKDAIYLDNIFPRSSDVSLRKGWEEFASVPVGSSVKSMLSYSAVNGTYTFFGADDTGIYDISAGGAIAAIDSICTDGDWISVMTGTAGGNFLWCCNGVDDSRYFDGAAWVILNSGSTPALTGITSANITNVSLFKQRLIFTNKDSLSFYYLPVNSVAGIAVEFPLASLFTYGGYLVATAGWSLDAGEGIDDYFVAITSNGEVAVYKGTDPGDATAWALVGIYFIGTPIGKKCLTKVAGDLAVITVRGVWPLSKALISSTISKQVAITDKIEQAFVSAAERAKTLPGWQAVLSPENSMLLVNVPITAINTDFEPTSNQYVMNTTTKAWCRFTGMDAHSFIMHNGDLYFSFANKIRKALTGNVDGAVPIIPRCKTAFTPIVKNSGLKRITLIKPIMTLTSNLNINFGIDVDYEDNDLIAAASSYAEILALWDVAVWDVDYWPDSFVSHQWRSVAHKMGYTVSFRLRFTADNVTMLWNATELIVESGGLL